MFLGQTFGQLRPTLWLRARSPRATVQETRRPRVDVTISVRICGAHPTRVDQRGGFVRAEACAKSERHG